MKADRIEEIDKNMRVESAFTEEDLAFYDVRQDPFDVYGLYQYRTEPEFKRLPDDVAEATSPGVAHLAKSTAGGRVRFSTDSDVVVIRSEMPYICRMDHMALTGSAGFDLYDDDPELLTSRFHGTFRPSVRMEDGYTSKMNLWSRKKRFFTIHFPTYSGVKNLWIGLSKDATVDHGMPYRPMPPIVYYGSSITQGACSSHPGNAYQAIIARRNGIDFQNFGFSGCGKGEDAIVSYLASLPMSVFVSDYDHNAPDFHHLEATHCKLYCAIREKHPEIPYIMVSRPDFRPGVEDMERRRDVITDTFRYARESGDRNVYYVDGESLFRGPDAELCTVEGCHPTDAGLAKMADAIGHEINMALYLKKR